MPDLSSNSTKVSRFFLLTNCRQMECLLAAAGSLKKLANIKASVSFPGKHLSNNGGASLTDVACVLQAKEADCSCSSFRTAGH